MFLIATFYSNFSFFVCISDFFLNWFNSFLSDRSQTFVLEGESSSFRPITSGVPQGSILGPLLFILFINDTPHVLLSSTAALFVHYCKIFRVILSSNHCVLLQRYFYLLSDWSKKWKMNFNATKCKVLIVTRQRNPTIHSYNLDGNVLENVFF